MGVASVGKQGDDYAPSILEGRTKDPTADVVWFAHTQLAVVDLIGLGGRGHENVPTEVMSIAAERARLRGEMGDMQTDLLDELGDSGLFETFDSLESAQEHARIGFPERRYQIFATQSGYEVYELTELLDFPAYNRLSKRIRDLDISLSDAGWATSELVVPYD